MKKNIYSWLAIFLFVVLSFIAGCSSSNSSGDDDDDDTPLSIPSSILSNCIGFLTGAPDEISLINTIGGGWTRPHSGPFVWGYIETSDGTYDFEETDEVITIAQNNNVAILGTIWPFAEWDQESCHGSECEVSAEDQFYPGEDGKGGIPPSRCAPCGTDDYKEFLTSLVERYDGDRTGDMSGLTLPVKYWEILNEPEMDSTELTFYKGTKAEYVEILTASYEAIKAACSDCSVVQGGAAGAAEDNLDYWGDIFDLGGGDYFDIANIHYINSGDLSSLNVTAFSNLMNEKGVDKPIWVTEAEFGDESEVESATEGALTAGASKIFFTSFEIGGTGPPSGEYSDIYDGITDYCN